MDEFIRDRQKLDPATAATRRRYVTMAETWTATQAARLGVSGAELLTAICRGWLPGDIERLPSSMANSLNRSPIVAALASAPILAVPPDSGDGGRWRDRYVSGRLRARGGAKGASLLHEKAA